MKSVVIIGAGLGGLTSGALLAKAGYHVTVLEQHTQVGGCATTYPRAPHFRAEVGLHMMNSPFEEDTLHDVLASLGVFEVIEFVEVPEFFSLHYEGGSFTMPFGVDEAIEAMQEAFPQERDAIAQMFADFATIEEALNGLGKLSWQDIFKAFGYIRTILRHYKRDAQSYIDDLFDDPMLKKMLFANVAYYHDKPQELSLLYFVMAQYSFIKYGGYFIKGGSQVLSNYLASIIEAHGGEVRTKTLVTAIDVQNTKATLVRAKHKGNTLSFQADWVLSNASPHDVYGTLLPRDYYDTSIDKLQNSISLLTIYLGFTVNLKTHYGTRPYTIGIAVPKCDDALLSRDFGFTDYAQIESGLCGEHHSVGTISMVGYIQEWEHLDEATYEATKQKVLAHTLEKLDAYYPDIARYVAFADVGTPRTMRRYLHTPHGEVYGFAPTPMQVARRFSFHSKTVKNLRFVGAWSFGGGFSPAIMSGYNSIKDLVKKLS
ncbi:MAG: hypothetical protein KU37_08170 [Sulfuricurvum sp. PC08-66]|nr:MAG: hypothetical protein KU37_08170 [Sulfuricurvum sp. PC08-66]